MMLIKRGKNISYLRTTWIFLICKILNSLHPWMSCTKFGWNRHIDQGEDKFLNFVNVFLLYVIIYPCKGRSPSLWQILVLEKKMKVSAGWTDDQKSSLDFSTQVSLKQKDQMILGAWLTCRGCFQPFHINMQNTYSSYTKVRPIILVCNGFYLIYNYETRTPCVEIITNHFNIQKMEVYLLHVQLK